MDSKKIVENGPTEPRPLTNEPLVETFMNIIDVLLCVVPFILLSKAILCIVAAHIDQYATGAYVDDVSPLTSLLIQANGQLVTAFTILFVTIMTTLTRRFALYRAQKGDSVARLEQLQASISLPSTIKTALSLRAFTFTSLALVAIWSFYYLGSQASKREYAQVISDPYHHINLVVATSMPPSALANSNVSNQNQNSIDQTYNLALSAQNTKQLQGKAFDINGAVLVPWFGYSKTGSADRHSWYHVVQAGEGGEFASFYGSTIFATQCYNGDCDSFTSSVVGTYTSSSSYIVASCDNLTAVSSSLFPTGTLNQSWMSLNMTNQPGASNPTNDAPRSMQAWIHINETAAVMTTCRLTMEFVDMEVDCDGLGCSTKKMRFTPGANSTNRTPLDDDTLASNLFNGALLSDGVPDYMDDSTITGSLIPIFYNTTFEAITQQFGGPLDISVDLTQIINTYYAVSRDPQLLTAYPVTSDMPSILNGSYTNYTQFYQVTKLDGAVWNPHYALSIPWLVVDMVSCVILFIAALAAMLLRKRTIAPDIFGYVSSLTRDNPNLHLPDGGTALSGMDRARLMKNVKVRFADLGTDERLGRVGLSVKNETAQGYLSKGKQYV